MSKQRTGTSPKRSRDHVALLALHYLRGTEYTSDLTGVPSIKVELPYQPGANVYQGKVETAAVNYTTACGVCVCVPALHTWAVSVCQVSLSLSLSLPLSLCLVSCPGACSNHPGSPVPKDPKDWKTRLLQQARCAGAAGKWAVLQYLPLALDTHTRALSKANQNPKPTQTQQQAFLLISRRRAGDWQRAMFLTPPCRVTRSFF